MSALTNDDDFVSKSAVVDPLTQEAFHGAATVDIRSIKGVSTGFEEVVEHHESVRHVGLIIAAHDKARDWLVDTFQLVVSHVRRLCLQWSAMNWIDLAVGFFLVELKADSVSPCVENPCVGKAIAPIHRLGLGET